MNYIVFEDQKFQLLSPFTDLHATFEVRVGIFTNIDRIIFQLSEQDTIQVYVRTEIEDIIRERYPDIDVNPKIFKSGICLNGSVIWYIEDIDNIDKELSYCNLNGLVAFMNEQDIDKDELNNFIKERSIIASKSDILSIKYLWDTFEILSDVLKKDYEILYNYKKGRLHPSCILIKEEDIIINDNALVSAGTILDASEGPIVIDDNAILDIGVMIKGPAYVGKNSIINPGAKIRGPVSIGPYCKVGGEIEDSVIHGFSNKQHDGFLGHSYIGEWVNLGANTNTSDLKNNYSNIRVQLSEDDIISTEKMFIGSIIGDFTSTAISTRLNSGTCIGIGSNIFNEGFQEKYIPPFSWGNKDKVGLNRFIKKCELIMNRRDRALSESLKNRLINLWKR